MSDLRHPAIPHPPYDELRAALGTPSDHTADVDDLHTAMNAERPAPDHVRASVDRLRGVPELEARIANWFDSPRVQQWLFDLSETGL